MKYVDGLRFRAISAGAFLCLFMVFEFLGVSDPGAFVAIFPVLVGLVAINVAFWFAGKWSDFSLRHFYAHWVVDLIVISVVLHLLGGVDAPYGFFAYLMIVVTSATFISKRASFMVATGATIATVILVGGEAAGAFRHIPFWPHQLALHVQLVTVAMAVAFYYMFAYLAGTLADQLKSANVALNQARREIEEQNVLLEHKVNERTAELQQRNAEIEEFVHIVTHDLKNLSVGATESARKLLTADSQRLSERGAKYAHHLMEDARTMNEMLRHLLAIFRIDQEKRREQVVSLAELTDEILKSQAARVEAKGVSIQVGTLPTVHADEAQVRHVITNLVDNALKYVGDKSQRSIMIDARSTSEEVVVTVADNGIGIPQDQQERVFQLYHRAPEQSVAGSVQTGDGVGLAICKRIVERWGGRIWVSSEAGRGSEFNFSIPKRRASVVGE